VEDASDPQVLRSRLVTMALDERRRVERALHDGVQQDLIGISVRLQLLRSLVSTAPSEVLASLDEIQQEVRDALDRVRGLASEVFPAILDARGLPDALRQGARASRAAAHVEAAGLSRYPDEIEAAVFFVWRSVLDGVAEGATARIRVWEEGGALQVRIEAAAAIDPARAEDLVKGAGGTLAMQSDSGSCNIEAAFPLG
jgi:signal transduction histidine kinase